MANVETGNNRHVGALLIAIGRTMMVYNTDAGSALSGVHDGDLIAYLCENGIDGEVAETLSSAAANEPELLEAYIASLA